MTLQSSTIAAYELRLLKTKHLAQVIFFYFSYNMFDEVDTRAECYPSSLSASYFRSD